MSDKKGKIRPLVDGLATSSKQDEIITAIEGDYDTVSVDTADPNNITITKLKDGISVDVKIIQIT